jgi:AcrR family transcriptional regulator
MGVTSRQRGRRRTQEERSAHTRALLLDATLESLIEVGYAGTTTRRVAEIAGVSQGAQTHHFPYRVDLVSAAVEHVGRRRLQEVRTATQDLPREREARARALLEMMWSDFSSPLFTAVVKLWVAAADDPELHRRLLESERALVKEMRALLHDSVGDLDMEDPDFRVRLEVAFNAVRGLALTQAFEPVPARRRRERWPQQRDVLVTLLVG